MKTLLLNGSPHKQGNTHQALTYVADTLEKEGIQTEIFQLPPDPSRGCIACMACKERANNRCAFDDGSVNTILEKMESADALVIGSPVYYAGPSGHLLSTLDRVFYSGSAIFKGKPGAAVCVARRGGGTSTLDRLQKYFPIAGMPLAPSTYWPLIYGRAPGEIDQDEEGIQEMQMLGKTISWLLKCIDAGRATGISYPEIPSGKKIMTNFVR